MRRETTYARQSYDPLDRPASGWLDMDNALTTSADVSPKSRGVALLLCSVLGIFGAHRFYTGKHATGVLMVGTLGGLGLWWLYDLILLAAGSFRDDAERRVLRWWEPNLLQEDSFGAGPNIGRLLDEIDALRSEMGDLDERVDFMERILAQVREQAAIPPSVGT